MQRVETALTWSPDSKVSCAAGYCHFKHELLFTMDRFTWENAVHSWDTDSKFAVSFQILMRQRHRTRT